MLERPLICLWGLENALVLRVSMDQIFASCRFQQKTGMGLRAAVGCPPRLNDRKGRYCSVIALGSQLFLTDV